MSIHAGNHAVGASDLYAITNPEIPEIDFVLVDFNEATNTAHVAPSETYHIANGLIYAVSIAVGGDATASTKIVFDDADYIDDGTFVPYYNPINKSFEFYAVGIAGKLEHDCSVTAIVHAYVKGAENKLVAAVDGSVTEITEEDLVGCTAIRAYAFRGCSHLVNVTIPASVESVGSYGLQIGNGATIRFLAETPCTIASNSMDAIGLEKIIVPMGCTRVYGAATNWSNFYELLREDATTVQFSQAFLDSWSSYGAERISVSIEGHDFTDPDQITPGTLYETGFVTLTDVGGDGFYWKVNAPTIEGDGQWGEGTHNLDDNVSYEFTDLSK